MKKLPKNLVAFVFFSILLFGFFYGNNTAQAQAQAPTGSSTTLTAATSSPDVSYWGEKLDKIKSRGADYAAGLLLQGPFTIIQVTLVMIAFILLGVLVIVGSIFDQALAYSIYHLGDLINQLNPVWILFRDIVNVFFIFILLYIAIKKILGSSGFDEKKALGNVILNAIFVNFSMFIAKFLIDVGNIIAIAFYNQIGLGSEQGISNMILSSLHLKELFSLSLFASGTEQINILIILLGKIIIVSVTTYVFFWAAILFLGRAVMLIYLVITSPIAYFGNTVPRLKGLGEEWWKNFTDQVLVAPVFLLFMVIIQRVLSISVKDIGNQVNNANGNFNIAGYFVFIFITMLLMKALKETKKLSGEVGAIADKVAGAATGLALGVATGGATQTLGLAAAAINKNDSLREAGSKAGITGIGARLALRATGAVAKSDMDIRNTGLGKLAKEQGLNLGDYKKQGGFVGRQEAYAKGQAEFAKNNLTRNDFDTKGEATQKILEDANKASKEREEAHAKEITEINTKRNTAQQEVAAAETKFKEEQAKAGTPQFNTAKMQQLETELKKKKEQQAQEEKDLQEKEKKAKENLEKKSEKEIALEGVKNAKTPEEVRKAQGTLDKLIEKEQKDIANKYQNAYAKVEENAILAGANTTMNILGKALGVKTTNKTSFNKAAADTIRKQTKGKSEDEQLAELAKKMIKKEEEAAKETKPTEEASEKPKAPETK